MTQSMPRRRFRDVIRGRRRRSPARQPTQLFAGVEALERRDLLATNVLTFHNDIAGNGVNAAEQQLTPANVKVGSFGKIYATAVDGQVYTQPLVQTGVTIVAGPNTTPGSTGLHDVVFVGTQNDTLYAIDASVSGGAVLWKRSFTDITVGNDGTVPGTNINNTLSATAITPVPYADLGTGDISPVVGITGTPVIDAATGTLYVSAKTKETVGGVAHYVNRLHAISVADGTDKAVPYLVGDTRGTNTNNTQIYVYGSGDGAVTDPYNGTGKQVVQFNSRRANQRAALSLVGNTLYVSWASHGDNGPYHGWVTAWDVGNLATNGFTLSGVLNTCPNGGLAGIWQAGGKLSFESDGSAFYFETGNGPSNAGAPVLDASGFPVDASYYEALVKAVPDATTSPTNQNANGWGFRVADYFIPYNQTALDTTDQDFGSGAPLVLPDSAGIPGHPRLLVASGKQGKIYVVDRDNLGKFNAVNDNVLNAVPDGTGHNTPPIQLGGSVSTPTYFNGRLYWVSGFNSRALSYRINASGTLTITSSTGSTFFGYLPGSVSVSSDGTNNGIVWIPDRNTNQIHAYDAATLSTELWNSGQRTSGVDNVGAVVKFAVPTVANGKVYVGTTSGLVVYGLTPPAVSVPSAPAIAASVLSGTSVNLSWNDPTISPNLATGYSIEQLINGTYQRVTTAPAGSTNISIGGLSSLTSYAFRIRGFNSLGNSAYSNVAAVTTSDFVPVVDFSGGFAGSSSKLTYNGSAVISGTRARLTSGSTYQRGSVFTTSPVDVTRFRSSFQFEVPLGSNTADGFTFTLQGVGPTALGSFGGGLGYGPDGTNSPAAIDRSVAVKFDLANNAGEGNNSTGLYVNGAAPTGAGSIDLAAEGVDLHSGNVFLATLAYDGTKLSVTITDTVTGKSASQSYTVDIVANAGASAYVGFSAGTGAATAIQDIVNWTYSPNVPQAPAAPSGLGAVPASATSIALSWTNNATNQTAFAIDRATDSGFTQGLVTQPLPATPNAFTDTLAGLAPGSTFYYRIRATNSAGSSANSNVTSVTIPLAPAKPSDAAVALVTTSQIDLTWTDNAGRTADGYRILRAVNRGAFDLYASLPAFNATPPTTYAWSDTAVQPGTFYEYHIQAYNISGYNDFTGTGVTTLTVAPTALAATAAADSVALSWTAPAGAVAYNVYRGTAAGAETLLKAGVTSTSYTDTTAVKGTRYYVVTAVNGNLAPLAAESVPSSEVFFVPPLASVPSAPVLTAVALSSSVVRLLWTDATVAPNTASGYAIEQLVNGTYQRVATAAAGATAVNVTGLAAQTTFSFRISGSNFWGSSASSNIATVTTANGVPALTFGAGFAGSTTKLTFNGTAAINGTRARLTSGAAYQAGSFFSFRPVDVTRFNSIFQFQMTGGSTTADGLTFTIQGIGATALGSSGGGLGYGPDGTVSRAAIGKSVAIKFDLANNSGEGTNSTGLSINGAAPTSTGSVTLAGTGIDLHSGNIFQVALAYDGSKLTVIITDTVTGRSAVQNYTVNIVAAAGATAYVGFTAGTGVAVATQEIISWTFSPTAPAYPAAPSGLAITAASASSITLGWTNNATNQTGFVVDRATDSGFTKNLVTQTVPATATTLTDTASGIQAGTTFYYRIRATNTVGLSSNSAVVSARTLTVAPTTLAATPAANSVALTWKAPAGAVAYKVYRGTAAGAATLLNASVTKTSYTDTTVVAGTRYYYVVTAVNGNASPLAAESLRSNEVSAIPTAAAPTSLTASVPVNSGTGQISLSWTAATSATSYKIYRALTSGGQTATPLATLVTGTTYIDKTVRFGVKYYYKVVAVNAGGDSPLSNEASAVA